MAALEPERSATTAIAESVAQGWQMLADGSKQRFECAQEYLADPSAFLIG